MKRNYKLAANFNVVELTIEYEDYENYVNQIQFENENLIEMGLDPMNILDEEQWIVRVLQREYDMLSAIKVVNPIVTKVQESSAKPKETVQDDPPSEDQIKYGLSLGLKNPENMTKTELRFAIRDALNKKNR
jgi:hypothetical protein